MKNKIIITGHAEYASGLLSSYEMIMGPNSDIVAVDFKEDKDIVKEYQRILEASPTANYIFLCDILGGTPFKESAKLAHNQPNRRVVVGCNLGGLIEISLMKDQLSLEDCCNKLIDFSNKHTEVFVEDFSKEEEHNDGI